MLPHRHPFHEIIVILGGRMRVSIAGEVISASRGEVLFYQAGQRHEEWSDRRQPVRTIFTAFRTEEPLDWLPVRTVDSGGRIRQLASWMLQDQMSPTAPGTAGAWLNSLLEELRRLQAAHSVPWVEALGRYMQQHLHEPLVLDDLAEQGGMSRFAFVRKFRELTGRTPMAELRRMRLDHARTLLLTTSLPLKAIAPAVGLGDHFQLSKLFRKQFGLSPREARVGMH